LEPRKSQSGGRLEGIPEERYKPRFKLAVDIKITSRTCGQLSGRTIDIGESGIAALLKIEVPLGECVKLEFTPRYGPVVIYATVRQRNAFRYGFQFVEAAGEMEIIRATCRSLEMEQSLGKSAEAR
jgi:hypothetical protein